MERKSEKGFSIVELVIVIVVIGIIAAIAIPNLLAARRSANEAAAISSLRTISTSQETYESTLGGGNFGSLADLNNGGMIDSALAAGNKSGYNFAVAVFPSVPGNAAVYDADAIPAQFGLGPNGTGSRNFYTNESGVIYQSSTANVFPTATSPANRTVINGSPLNP